MLDEQARRSPDAAAIIDHPGNGAPRVTSFSQLRNRSARIAALIARAGLAAGDGLVVLVPMSAELYAVIGAALRIGAVPVFIDPARAGAQLDRCRGSLAVRAFVGSPMACGLRLLRPELRRIRPAFVIGGHMAGAASMNSAERLPPFETPVAGLDDAPAMLTFTAGSTGAAKGVLRSHRLLQATQEILLRHLGLRPGSINVATMPALVMANLAGGVTSLIPPGDLRAPARIDAARLAASIDGWKAESLLASPCVIEHLAAYGLARGHALRSLRQVVSGGAPVFLPVMDAAQELAPGARVTALYGSTEAEPIAVICRDEISAADRRAIAAGAGLPVGRPIEEIRLELLEDRWGRILGTLTPECFSAATVRDVAERGEVVVSGPHVSPAYPGGEGEAENKFRVDGQVWHRTGDCGRVDEEGRLWLAGRCSQRVGCPPSAVYPLAVEAALAGEPSIARSAFVNRNGRNVLALELRLDARPPTLEQVRRIVPWARIEQVVRLRRIPVDRRHNAKVDYPRLRHELDQALRGADRLTGRRWFPV